MLMHKCAKCDKNIYLGDPVMPIEIAENYKYFCLDCGRPFRKIYDTQISNYAIKIFNDYIQPERLSEKTPEINDALDDKVINDLNLVLARFDFIQEHFTPEDSIYQEMQIARPFMLEIKKKHCNAKRGCDSLNSTDKVER